MSAKLQKTKDYDLFELHRFNRPIREKPALEKSMREHGFMPSSPIQCVLNGAGKLKIVRGHHRFYYAKKLGIPVYYIQDDSNCNIFELEGYPGQSWSITDFAAARAKAGDKHCIALLSFKKKHGLAIGSAASLVRGQGADSGNMGKTIKRGTFRVGDMTHANQVVKITDLCREHDMPFATNAAFVSAISMTLRVPEFDAERFRQKIAIYPAMLHKRGDRLEYLDEIETLYNYNTAMRLRISVAFRAVQVGQERKRNFGDPNKKA